jgi:hypothetical protein
MRFRLHCLPFFGFGLLSACWMFVLIVLPQRALLGQSGGGQQSPRHPAPTTSPGAIIPMPPDRAEDSYAIYALLMPGETLASLPAEQGAPWAIVEVTINDADRSPRVPPQGQLKPPPDNPKGFGEAVGDYASNRYTRIQLNKDDFHLTHPFALVNPNTAKNSGYPGVTFFSEVFFDSKHEAALVYQSEWCANLCASGTWIYLEKHGGQWARFWRGRARGRCV